MKDAIRHTGADAEAKASIVERPCSSFSLGPDPLLACLVSLKYGPSGALCYMVYQHHSLMVLVI